MKVARDNNFFSRGFTMIEIILVVLLLGVIAGIALPNFGQTYRQVQLQQVTENLAYVMRYSQGRAVSKVQMVRLEFAQDFSSYQLLQSSSEHEGSEIGQDFSNIAGRLGRKVQIPEEVQIQTSDPQVDFYPDGTIDKQRIYVCLKEKCQTVSTQEQKGFVQVFDSKIE